MFKFLCLVLISFAAYGQGDLSGNLRGQAGNARNNFGALQVPNNQATKTGAINALIETGNKNLLANPGFEHTTFSTGWTTSGTAVYSGTTTTSEVLAGLKSFRAVATAQTIDLLQDTTLLASSRAGSQMFYRFSARNTAPGVTACVRANGVKLTGGNNCLALATDNVTRTYELAFLANGTSNGIEIDSASTTGTLIVDEVEISTESSAFIDVAQIGPWIDYTPTFQGLGTVTVIDARYRVVGASIQLNVAFTSGTSTASELRIGLPLNLVTDTGSTTNVVVGNFIKGIGTSGAIKRDVVIAPDAASYVLFASGEYSIAANPSIGLNGNAILGLGDRASFFATIPVQGLSNKITTFSQFAVSDVSVENVFSAKVSSTGVVSGENLDWISGNAVITNTATYALAFSSNIFTQAPNCVATAQESVDLTTLGVVERVVVTNTGGSWRVTAGNTGGPIAADWRIICTKQGADYKAKNVITGSFSGIEKCADPYECTDTFSAKVSSGGVVSGENIDWIDGNCSYASGVSNCTIKTGIGVTQSLNCASVLDRNDTNTFACRYSNAGSSSTNARTICGQTGVNSASNEAYTLVCQKQGVDFRPKTAVAGTFIDSVVSPGAGRPVLYSFYKTGSSVVQDDYGDLVNGNCSFAANLITCPFNSGKFSQKPNCVVNSFESTSVRNYISTLTTSQIIFAMLDGSGTGINANAMVMCHGVQ